MTDAFRDYADVPNKGKTRRHVKVPGASRQRNTCSALSLMVLVPFRAVPVRVYAESDLSATAEKSAGTDYLVMVPEYQGYPRTGTLVAANSFLAIRNHKIANQASRKGGIPQPCFQWPETVELKQQ